MRTDDFSKDLWLKVLTMALETNEALDELRVLRELREICGMYCEQLPVEVRDALHSIPEIEKTHPHTVGGQR